MALKETYDIRIDEKKAKENKKHGINMIAYTSNPAIEIKGLYFNDQKKSKEKVLNDTQKSQAIEYLQNCGEQMDENWKEVTIDEYLSGERPDNNKFVSLKEMSVLDRFSPDGKGVFMLRYQYEGPYDDGKNRDFCFRVMSLSKGGRVYSYEEINQELTNSEFGNYSIFNYKGSYGCRHVWKRKYFFVDFEDKDVRRVGSNPVTRQVADGLDREATTINAKLSIDEYKMRVAAPALIPNKKIPRIDEDTDEVFYVTFSEEEIEKLWSNFQSKNIDVKFNVDHTDDVAPAYLYEGWIIETDEDKAYSKYHFNKEEVPVGSLIIVSQITDGDFFLDEIIEKKQYGYSVEGFFDIDLKLKKMAEEKNTEVKKYELDGKFYTEVDGKLQLMEDDIKKDEEEVKEKDEVREKMEEKDETKMEDEVVKEEVVEEDEKEESKYYSKEEMDTKFDEILGMIAKLESGREEKEEEEVKEDEFKKVELKEVQENNNTIAAKLNAVKNLINRK